MNAVTDTHASYHEEQRFRQPWLWVLILVSVLLVAVIFGYALVKQPWTNDPVLDTALAVMGGLHLLFFGVALPLFFYALKLVTEVRHDGLHIRFFPLHRRRIAFDDIRHCEARTYHPVREFGGWGIRWGRSGTAYNVSGNRGVQLELANGKRLLIGSQRADDLARAIQAALRQ